MSRPPVAVEDCPEPYWHETHRYCPACVWTEDYGKPEPVAMPYRETDPLATRIEARLRAEWPGTTVMGRGTAPSTIRENGMTDTLIKLAVRLVREEESRG